MEKLGRPPPRALAAAPPSQETSLVGRIDISQVGISAMVLEGDDARTLARGVGHIPGTALPGPAMWGSPATAIRSSGPSTTFA